MITAVGDFAVFYDWPDRDNPAFVTVDRDGHRQKIDIADPRCRVRRTGSWLVLDYGERGLVRVDLAQDFGSSAFKPWHGVGEEPDWTHATLSRLLDVQNLLFRPYTYDREALALPDSGYSEPVDSQFLPSTNEVAIFIVRCRHFALFNIRSGETRLLPLRSYGSSDSSIEHGHLWFNNYDAFCRYDSETQNLASSEVLQPPFRDEKHRLMTTGFVGVPEHAPSLGGWLIPRPYSGDILLVRSDTLAAEARIACGGRPYEVALLADGSLVLADHPTFELRIAHLNDLKRL